jgi:hypothetical protein
VLPLPQLILFFILCLAWLEMVWPSGEEAGRIKVSAMANAKARIETITSRVLAKSDIRLLLPPETKTQKYHKPLVNHGQHHKGIGDFADRRHSYATESPIAEEGTIRLVGSDNLDRVVTRLVDMGGTIQPTSSQAISHRFGRGRGEERSSPSFKNTCK